ncbi:MAG TPA: helix-turn-helix transcriptional regulator [Acidimicrobiia bacterium]|nr:helix-turn-helix transcriptional regulator [Acidimicrobiia bacterium]
MPERSFGRMVRYRRTKLGLSQAQLGELVGRSAATIRSWERDRTRPNEEKVLSALSAILGVDERQLFAKAEVELPDVIETSPTVEQALATLTREGQMDESAPVPLPHHRRDRAASSSEPISVPKTPPPAPLSLEPVAAFAAVAEGRGPDGAGRDDSNDWPAYPAPAEPYVQTPITPTLADLSYVEDPSQRQMYRVRNLATLVGFVALVVAFVWAMGEGLGALGDWWGQFFGNLRL